MPDSWYTVRDEATLDSPSLLIYRQRVAENIQEMIRVAGSPARLMPHVKTYKMAEIVRMQVAEGITRFKAATVAEAEMAAEAGAEVVVISHQLVGPKVERLVALREKFPEVDILSLVDSPESAKYHNDVFAQYGLVAEVLVDVNNGMNRTGHGVDESLFAFYQSLYTYPNLHGRGLHVYDGNIRDSLFADRKASADLAFEPIDALIKRIEAAGLPAPMVVAGGTPTFTVHTHRKDLFCSPGTSLLSDWGYSELLTDQSFNPAAVLVTRVISKPKPGYITTDLGHKAVAAENPLEKRVKFLNLTDYQFVSQSEEHLVLEVPDSDAFHIGDVLYGIPYHVCPTVNLYEEVYVIENQEVVDTWQVVARKRKITV